MAGLIPFHRGMKLTLPSAALGVLRWCFPPASLHDELIPKPSLRCRTAEQQCDAAKMTADIDWKCGSEVIIMTDGKPDDHWAILGLFHRATKMYLQQRCAPQDYPIKEVIGGGGYDSELWHRMLVDYLRKLEDYGLIPPGTFNIDQQVHEGPIALDPSNERIREMPDAFHQGWGTYHEDVEYSIFSSLDRTLLKTMDILAKYREPIIVALRPVFEYVVWWAEYSRDTEPFAVSGAYLNLSERIAAMSGSTFAEIRQKYNESLQVIERSQVIMYQGDRNLEQMGAFFSDLFLFSIGHMRLERKVRDMDESFVNLPRKFLLIDREASADMYRPTRRPRLFNSQLQAHVFEALSHVDSLRDLFYNIATTFNRKPVLRRSFDLQSDIHRFCPNLLGDILAQFTALAELASRFSEADAKHRLTQSDMDMWQEQSRLFQTILREQCDWTRARRQRNRNIERVQVWVTTAAIQASSVVVGDILVPLCFEPGPNSIKNSFVRVKYDGWDYMPHRRAKNYKWAVAAGAENGGTYSNVWLTRIGTSRSDMQALQNDLGSYYSSCLTRQ